MGWTNQGAETLTVPASAGPDDPVMILTASDLPQPVRDDGYETGIMWRSTRSDNSGQYWFIEAARRVPDFSPAAVRADLARGWWLEGDDRWYIVQREQALIVAGGVNAVVETIVDGDLDEVGPGGRAVEYRNLQELTITNTPTVFAGSAVSLGTDLAPDDHDVWGSLNINDGSTLSVLAGGALQIESGGFMDVLAGGEINVFPGASLDITDGGQVRVDGRKGYLLVDFQQASAAADITLTNVNQVANSISITTNTANALVKVTSVAIFDETAGPQTTTCISEVDFAANGGAAVVQSGQGTVRVQTASDGDTATQVYRIAVATAGNHTVRQLVRAIHVAGTKVARANSTRLMVEVYEAGS